MINASPNKIYDGIQTETPLLINKEVTAASLVENLNIVDSHSDLLSRRLSIPSKFTVEIEKEF